MATFDKDYVYVYLYLGKSVSLSIIPVFVVFSVYTPPLRPLMSEYVASHTVHRSELYE